MSSMLKLLATATALLLSSSLLGDTSYTQIQNHLEKSFKSNPNIISLKVNVVDKIALDAPKNWDAFIVSIDATVKTKQKERIVSQKMIWFASDGIIAPDLIDMNSGESLKDLVSPSFKSEYYKKENLIYGNANAKHKVAIFSDPLCPFCRNFVPKAIKYMKEKPELFAVYYYHFPLPSLHPAAVELVKAATAAELKGHKDVVLGLYEVEVDAREKDVNKILAAFNKQMKTDIKASDLDAEKVLKHYNSDQKIASDVMVQGTPTVFFDGKIDKSKRQYEKVK
ncbi:thioredoxin domain-containing protein [bacterium]|nr:thioredoxin domain-containing protein [bacterium]MBU1991195.1 thioredoxin domain-containing protein [bacterium]